MGEGAKRCHPPVTSLPFSLSPIPPFCFLSPVMCFIFVSCCFMLLRESMLLLCPPAACGDCVTGSFDVEYEAQNAKE